MFEPEKPSVRPTRRALDDLGVKPPDARVPLHEIEHSDIKEMQSYPDLGLAQGLKRVVRLKDRVWFKYKSSNVRAAVTKLPEHDVPEVFVDDTLHGRWWIGAAGIRRDDSPQHDFYARLVNEAETAAKKRRSKGIENSDPTYTGHLLPGEWDQKRWVLESATRWANGMKRVVVGVVALSLKRGRPVTATAGQHQITAFVHVIDGICYLVVGSAGVADTRALAAILSAVPGVGRDDWAVEPTDVPGIQPASGELVWSAILTEEVCALIYDQDPGVEVDDQQQPVCHRVHGRSSPQVIIEARTPTSRKRLSWPTRPTSKLLCWLTTRTTFDACEARNPHLSLDA